MRDTDQVEAHLPRLDLVSVSRVIREPDFMIFKSGVDQVRHGLEEVFEELQRGSAISLVEQLGDIKPTGSANADKEIQLSLRRLNFGESDVQAANRGKLELLSLGLGTTDFLQPRDLVTL